MITFYLFLYLHEDSSQLSMAVHFLIAISPLLIHDEGVANSLSSLDDHKASEPDEIPTTLLKNWLQ